VYKPCDPSTTECQGTDPLELVCSGGNPTFTITSLKHHIKTHSFIVTVTEMSDSPQSVSSVDKMPPDSFQTHGFREEKTEEGREGKRNPAGLFLIPQLTDYPEDPLVCVYEGLQGDDL